MLSLGEPRFACSPVWAGRLPDSEDFSFFDGRRASCPCRLPWRSFFGSARFVAVRAGFRNAVVTRSSRQVAPLSPSRGQWGRLPGCAPPGRTPSCFCLWRHPKAWKKQGTMGIVLGLQNSSNELGPLSLDLGLATRAPRSRSTFGSGHRFVAAGKTSARKHSLHSKQGYYASQPSIELQDATDAMGAEILQPARSGFRLADGLDFLDVGAALGIV